MSDIDQLLDPARAPLHFKFDRNNPDGPRISSSDDNYSDPPYLFELKLSAADVEVIRKHLAYAREHDVSVTIPLAFSKHRFGDYEYETSDPLNLRGEGDTPECVSVSVSAHGNLQLEFTGEHTNVGYYARLEQAALVQANAEAV